MMNYFTDENEIIEKSVNFIKNRDETCRIVGIAGIVCYNL